ncbi:MAG: hypothetical protein LN573_04715 [Rickettsia endosymbiont of Oxypoda opaca]|nr:hypothetical protein [Rickettsia endosymbiont of Oxypoda opaca]
MNIAESLAISKVIVVPEEILGSGNFIPHQWYHIITTKFVTTKGNSRPDNNAITILSEIVYWHRLRASAFSELDSKEPEVRFIGDAWQTSYEHFERKFNYNKQRVRRAIIRLEELNLVKREFHIVSIKGQKYNNILTLRLNIEQFKVYCIEYLSNSCYALSSSSNHIMQFLKGYLISF